MQVIAHRGYAEDAIENSLSAFEAAIQMEFDGIEFDIQLASDGIPVIHHDLTALRTHKQDISIAQSTSKELGAIGIPTLEQALQLLARKPNMWLDAEIKAPAATDAAMDLLRDYRGPERTLVSSMDLDTVYRLADQEFPVGAIIVGPFDVKDCKELQSHNVPWLMADGRYSEMDDYVMAKEFDLRVGVWTVNKRRHAAKLEAPCEWIITDSARVLAHTRERFRL